MPRARHLASVPANERATSLDERAWQRRRSPSGQTSELPTQIPRELKLRLYRAMLLSRGDPTVFVTHPLSLGLLLASLALLVVVILPGIRAKREEAFSE